MSSVLLYSYPPAFNPAKAKLALEEKGIKYQEKTIDIFGGQSLEPWYLKLNPQGSAPTLVAGDKVIAESAEIVKWADEQEGGPLGGDKVDREFIADWVSKVDKWDGNLFVAAFGSLGGVLKSTNEHKIKVAEASAKRNPELADNYNQKVTALKAATEDWGNKSKGETNKAQLVQLLDDAEERLGKTKYLAGNEYSIADAMFIPVLYRIPMVKLDKELIDSRPNVKNYWVEAKKRPTFKKVFGVTESGLRTASVVLPSLARVQFAKLTGRY